MGLLSNLKTAPDDFQKRVRTGGAIEAKYLADGPYGTASQSIKTLQEFGSYSVHYPKELETSDRKYPVIVMCNGTGTPASKYPAVFRHYASWGFIAIGTEENYSWNAFGAEMCVRFLERLNGIEKIDGKDCIFYDRVDMSEVGIAGHSQGGVGVISALTDTHHKSIYKAAAALSPTNTELAHSLFWDYDPSGVETPLMLMSGAGGGDDWVVTLEQLRGIYRAARAPKIMARRSDTPHGETLYSETGYVTAWFMWLLQGDIEAAKAFTGGSPEMAENKLYRDLESDLGSL